MPIYEYNGKRYNIPEAKIEELVTRMPGAKLIGHDAPDREVTETVQQHEQQPAQQPSEQSSGQQEQQPVQQHEQEPVQQRNFLSLGQNQERNYLSLGQDQGGIADVNRTVVYPQYQEERDNKRAIKNDLAELGADLQSKIEDRDKENAQRWAKEDEERKEPSAFQKLLSLGGNPNAAIIDPKNTDPVRNNYQTAKHFIDEANLLVENVESGAKSLKGVTDSGFDIDTWSLGIADLNRSSDVMEVVRKYENKEKLTEDEDAILDALALNLATNAFYASDLPRQYTWGQIAGESLPFMMEFILNPIAGGGKGIAKTIAGRALKKFAVGKGGRTAIKAGSRIFGDALGAAGMTLTTGSPRAVDDAINRNLGEATFDRGETGEFEYTGHEGGVDPVQAGLEAFLASTIEYQSEMVGSAGVGKLLKKTIPMPKFASSAMGNLKASGIGRAYKGIANSNAYKEVRRTLERGQWSGTFGEYGEELYGTGLNAILVGDSKLSDLTDIDQQVDTFMGLAITGGVTGSVSTVAYVGDRARTSHKLSKADEAGGKYFQNWEHLKDQLATFSVSDLADAQKDVIANKDIPVEGRRAFSDYIYYSTYQEALIGANQQRHEDNIAYAKTENAKRLKESITNKQSVVLPTLNKEMEQLEAELGDLVDLPYEEVANSPESTPELLEAKRNHEIASSEYVGVIESLKTEVDEFIAPQIKAIEDIAVDGQITELNVGTEEVQDIVYLAKGDIAVNEDGTVDTDNTEPILIVTDSEGKKRMVSRNKISSVKVDDLGVTVEAIRQQAFEKFVRPLSDKMEDKVHFEDGQQVEYVDDKGKVVAGTVAAQQNGTVTVVANDGKKTETLTENQLASQLITESIDDVKVRDVIQVEIDGEIYEANVTSIQDGKAELYIPSFPEASGRYQDVTAEELRKIRVVPQAEDIKKTEEAPKSDVVAPKQVVQNDSKTPETESESQITPEQLRSEIEERRASGLKRFLVKDFPIKKFNTEGDHQLLIGDEAELAESWIGNMINRGVERGKSVDEIIRSITSQYAFDAHETPTIKEFIKDKIAGTTSQTFAEFRRDTSKNVKDKYDAELAALDKIETEKQAEAEKQLFLFSLPVVQSGKRKGQIDQSQMTPDQNIKYFEYQYGQDKAIEASQKMVQNLNEKIVSEQKKLDNDPFNIELNENIQAMQSQLQAYKAYADAQQQQEQKQDQPQQEPQQEQQEPQQEQEQEQEVEQRDEQGAQREQEQKLTAEEKARLRREQSERLAKQKKELRAQRREEAKVLAEEDRLRIEKEIEAEQNDPNLSKAEKEVRRLMRQADTEKEELRNKFKKAKPSERESLWGDVQSLREHIMRELIKGQRILWGDSKGSKGFAHHLGLKGSETERKKYIGLLGSAQKTNAKTPEQIAHDVWQDVAFSETDQFFGVDTEEILGEILDILNTYTSKGQMIKAINSGRLDNAFAQIDGEVNMAINELESNQEESLIDAEELYGQYKANEREGVRRDISDEEYDLFYKNQITHEEFEERIRNFKENFNDYGYEEEFGSDREAVEQGSEAPIGEGRDNRVHGSREAQGEIHKVPEDRAEGRVESSEAIGDREDDQSGESKNAQGPIGRAEGDLDGENERRVEGKEDLPKTEEGLTPITREQYESFDTRGYSYAVVKDGKVVTRGSNPKLAKTPMPIKNLLELASSYDGELYIAPTSNQPLDPSVGDAFIVGLTWQQIQDRQKGKKINLADDLKLPENAVLFPKYEESVKDEVGGKKEDELNALQAQFKEVKKTLKDKQKAYDAAYNKYLDLRKKSEKDPLYGMRGQGDMFGGVAGQDNMFAGQADDINSDIRKIISNAKQEADRLGEELNAAQKEADRMEIAIFDMRANQQVLFKEEQKKNDPISIVEKAQQAAEKHKQESYKKEASRLSEMFGADVEVHENLDGVSKDVRKQIESGGRTPGWYQNGKVHIYLPHTISIKDLQQTFFHEVIAHKGLRELLGDRFNDVMLDFFDKLPKEVQEQLLSRYKSFDVYKDKTDQELRIIAADEFIASVAENGEFMGVDQRTVLQRVIDAIKKFFNANNIEVRLADVERLANDYLRQSAENLQNKNNPRSQNSAEDIAFRSIQGNNKLVAIHNISADNLIKVSRIGGFSMPSIAITKPEIGFQQFGEITLIGNKDMIDPKIRANKVYGADAYTIRYPSISYEVKNTSPIKEIVSKMPVDNSIVDELVYDINNDGDAYLYENRNIRLMFAHQKGADIFKTVETDIAKPVIDFIREVEGYDHLSIKDNEDVKTKLGKIIADNLSDKHKKIYERVGLLENGAASENLINDTFDTVKEYIRKEGQVDVYQSIINAREYITNNNLEEEIKRFARDMYEQLNVTERIFKGYTKSGTLRYVPHTLENVLKEMKSNKGVGIEGLGGSFGQIRAKLVPEFKSIKGIKDKAHELAENKVSEEELNKALEQYYEISGKLEKYHKWNDDWLHTRRNFNDEIISLVRNGESESFKNLPKDLQEEIKTFAANVENIPTDYFEAKPERAIGLDEFSAAVLPKGTDQHIIDILNDSGIPIHEYDESNRMDVIQEVSEKNDLMFRVIGSIGASRMDGAEMLMDDLRVAREMEKTPIKTYFEKFVKAQKAVSELNKKEDYTPEKRVEHIADIEKMYNVLGYDTSKSDRDTKKAFKDAAQNNDISLLPKSKGNRLIKIATGWERGADNMWRYETPDTELDIEDFQRMKNPLSKLRIGEIDKLRDSGLLKAYPEIADIRVLFKDTDEYAGGYGKGSFGGDSEVVRAIILSSSLYKGYSEESSPINRRLIEIAKRQQHGYSKQNIENAKLWGMELTPIEELNQEEKELRNRLSELSSRAAKRMNSIFIHELQHAIQDIEGFARGGSLSGGADTYIKDVRAPRERDALALQTLWGKVEGSETYKEYQKFISPYSKKAESLSDEEYIEKVKELGDAYFNGEEYKNFEEKKEEFERKYKANLGNVLNADWLEKEKREYAFSHYKRLAGEVESRNVQSRMELDAESRKEKLLQETEDIAREDQIILFRAFEDGGFPDGLDQDGLYTEVSYIAEWSDAPSKLIGALEDYYKGELIGVSRRGREAIERDQLVPIPDRQYSGEGGEYHHISFKDSDTGEIKIKAVPFVLAEDVEERATIRFRHEDSKDVALFKYGEGGTKGVFKDSKGNLYKSLTRQENVYDNETKSFSKRDVPGETNEYEILKELQDNRNIVKVRDKVDTKQGPMFEMETLNEVDKLTYNEYNEIMNILEGINNQGYFVNDIVTVMRRPETNELVIVDFSSGLKNKSLIGDQSYDDRRNMFRLKDLLTKEDKEKVEIDYHNENERRLAKYIPGYEPDIRFRTVDESGFYSTAESALEGIKQNKGTPQQFKAMLLKNGAKQAELDWMDYDGSFTDKSVTKDEIQEWIDQNRIEVEEVKADMSESEIEESTREIQNDADDYVSEHAMDVEIESDTETREKFKVDEPIFLENGYYSGDADEGALTEIAKEQGYEDYDEMFVDMDRHFNELKDSKERQLRQEYINKHSSGRAHKYSAYQLPGGENYKELLLTMPKDKGLLWKQNKAGLWAYFVGDKQVSDGVPDNTYKGIARKTINSRDVLESQNADFKSSHFDEPNILAHVRFNERTVNGERVLFIEEIQSDWAQKGKKEGFRTDKLPDNVKIKEVGGNWQVIVDGRLKGEYKTEQRAKETAMADFGGVPNMPFKKTDQWVNLSLRRMMMYAAENGYDRIAWTTGEQQADRYDLSKQVDEVYYNPNTKEFGYFIKEDPFPKVYPETEPKDIENYVGKEVAKKLLEAPINSADLQSLKGDGLKVGGEGMKAFYNQIVPKAAKKLVKPFGAEVEPIQMSLINVDTKPDSLPKEVLELIDNYYSGEIEIDELSSELDNLGYELDLGMNDEIENVYKRDGETFTFQSIPVTDELREMAPEGMPLFRAIGEQGAANLDRADSEKLGKSVLSRIFNADTRLDNLSVAKDMEKAGKKARSIKLATGWEKGADNKWKYEVNDNLKFTSKFKDLKRGESLKLSEAVKAPELFVAYPEIADVTVTTEDDVATSGWFNPRTNTLNISPDRSFMPSTMKHEIQHWIQRKENFAKGGNYSTAIKALPDAELKSLAANTLKAEQARYDDIISRLEALKDLSKDDQAKVKDFSTRFLEAEESKWQLYNKLKDENPNMPALADPSIKAIDNKMDQIETEIKDAFPDFSSEQINQIKRGNERTVDDEINYYAKLSKGVQDRIDETQKKSKEDLLRIIGNARLEQERHNAYERLAGEVESRNVEHRAYLPYWLRRLMTLESTEDISRDDQIILFRDISNAAVNENKTPSREIKEQSHDDGRAKKADHLFENIDNLKTSINDYNGFLGRVFDGATNKTDIISKAKEKGFDKLGESIEEYLSNVEDPTELNRVKELLGVDMPDNALRYMLWRNANPNDGSVVWKAKDAVKTSELDDNILFRTGKDFSKANLNEYEKRIRSRHNRGFRSLMYGIEEGWFDRMASLRILQEAITGKKTFKDKENAYMYENQLSSRNTADIRHYTKKIVDPLIKQIQEVFGKDLSAADNYMNAKHGLERNKYMAREEAERKHTKQKEKLNQSLEDGDISEDDYNVQMELVDESIDKLTEELIETKDYSGLTALAEERDREDFTQNAMDMVMETEGRTSKEDIDALWQHVNNANKWTIQKQYDSGMMSKDTYEKINTMYEYYVPLRGFSELTATDMYDYMLNPPSSFEGTLKKAYGRTSKAESPIATILTMGESGIMQANRNRMKQAFYRLVATNPSNYASIEDVWYVKSGNDWQERYPEISPTATADETIEAIAEFNNEMAELSAEGQAVQGRAKLDVGVKILKAQVPEHIVKVHIAGEEKLIFINGNPRAAQAINGLLQKDLLKKDNLRHGVEYWSRQMSANFTSRNPAFMVTNLMRDVQFAVVSGAVKEGVGYSANLSKNILKVGKTISANVFSDGNKKNTEYQKYWEEFEANGGETGYANLNSIDYNRKYVNKKLREFSDQRDFIKPFRVYTQFMENGNRTIEDISRFATYVTSRQDGRSIERSVSDAKEITINFNRKGSGGFGANIAHSFYLFSNPAIQSMRLLGMMAKNHPIRFTAMLSSTMAAGFMVPMINELLLGLFGDDDDKEAYQNITPWVRRNNLVMYVPGTDGRFVTLMLPHELRAFYGIGEMAYEKANGGLRHENIMLETAKQMTAMMPIDPMGGSDWWVPDALKPPYQSYISNQNFMGSPVYKDSQWNKLDPEWTKAYKRTPEFLVEAAKGASDMTGGDDVVPGSVDLNPARAYHLFSGYLGGSMTTYTDLSMIAFNLLTGRDVTANDIPIVNKLIRTSDEDTKDMRINSEYFYYVDWIKEYEHRLKGYEKRLSDPKYAEKYRDIVTDDEMQMYNYAKGQMQMIKNTQEFDEDLSKEQKEEFVRQMWEYEDRLKD